MEHQQDAFDINYQIRVLEDFVTYLKREKPHFRALIAEREQKIKELRNSLLK